MIDQSKINPNLVDILEHLVTESIENLSKSACEILKSDLLTNQVFRKQVFRKIDKQNVDVELKKRSQILKSIFPKVIEYQENLQIPTHFATPSTLWYVWIPLAIHLGERYQGKTIIQGILGGQGTGKTTMTKFLKLILDSLGYECVNLSLDDLYKTYGERAEIKKLDPEIQWRGVPSTHDIRLGLDTLDRLCSDNSIEETSWEIPRFDKSLYSGAGDRIDSEKILIKPKIILFEGWFVGVRPLDSELIRQQVPEVDLQFVLKMNAKLEDYLPLWQKLDSLWLLLPQDYRFSLGWRQEAERKLITGMSNEEVKQFVRYFWRSLPPEIFITPLRNTVDLVIEINEDRLITALKTPLIQLI